MDAYGLSVDDLLDLPNDDFLSSSTSSSSSTATAADFLHHSPYSAATAAAATYYDQSSLPGYSTDFSNILCAVPSDDAAELEWLSTYMDDSFTDVPANELTKNDVVFHGRPRSKRSRPPSTTTETNPIANNVGGGVGTDEGVVRRCTHCASEKTPQWRTGPLGPKTLCNACGVRYKSGRLVPEYRPAASPTFVLTQHSNSHRKVLELRRQKEMLRQQQEGRGRHFPVC